MEAKQVLADAIANIKPPSQYRLARILGVTDQAVSNWKTGRAIPSGKHLLRLIEIAKNTALKTLAGVAILTSAALLPTQDANAASKNTHTASNNANSVYYVKWRTLLDLITSWIKTTTIKTMAYA